MLRFMTCGSVDDGKSTLIGRLLYESKQIFDDQLDSLKKDSIKFGTQGDQIDYALLVDGLESEREQGITIDVAYRFFSTSKRKFIVADTPGHEQYTRNMATAASTANLAILLVDARKGILKQTKRHATIVSLMGIKHVVVAINKMDLVHYDLSIYEKIKTDFETIASSFKFNSVLTLPLSALNGDNVFKKSHRINWYSGPALAEYLEEIEINSIENNQFIFPVQWVNRPNSNFRGFSGTIQSGSIKIGDCIRNTKSGQISSIQKIVTMDGDLNKADKGMAVTLTLSDEIDASRGDIFSLEKKPLETSDMLNTTLIWMSDEKGLPGRQFNIKLANQWAVASIVNIKYILNPETSAQNPTSKLSLNDIGVCDIHLSKLVIFDHYESSHSLGSFILVDKINNSTVAAGMINHSLRRSKNVHPHDHTITKKDREKINGHKGKVLWFTGLSGSGKSTLANALEVRLYAEGKHTFILDGDNIRRGLNIDLGFSNADRIENIRRIAEVAKLMCDAGLIVLVAFISPYEQDRNLAKQIIESENFLEIYVSTPLDVCEKRDTKGLYKKARKGLIPNLTGINSPYESPKFADIVLDNSEKFHLSENVNLLCKILNNC